MVLTIDIGNSTIAVGGYCGDQLRFLANLRTDRLKTADEYAVLFKSTLELHGCSPREITGAILASVVPSLVAPIRQAILLLSGADVYKRQAFWIRGSKSKLASACSTNSSLGRVRGCLGVKTVQQSS